jgi:hypothetical protein
MNESAATELPLSISCSAPPEFRDWLAYARGSLAISTYQAGKSEIRYPAVVGAAVELPPQRQRPGLGNNQLSTSLVGGGADLIQSLGT